MRRPTQLRGSRPDALACSAQYSGMKSLSVFLAPGSTVPRSLRKACSAPESFDTASACLSFEAEGPPALPSCATMAVGPSPHRGFLERFAAKAAAARFASSGLGAAAAAEAAGGAPADDDDDDEPAAPLLPPPPPPMEAASFCAARRAAAMASTLGVRPPGGCTTNAPGAWALPPPGFRAACPARCAACFSVGKLLAKAAAAARAASTPADGPAG
mmetsp:Transcript_20936/g.53221  ORF Transcript_20936/g.53221 Transcript_20936/m.53221 type:complete len:215 (-) Transcript_20936:29-673(-)